MEAIFHSFIKAFGWSIVHSFWQGAIIYALLFLILLAIPKLTPVAKHNLSYLSLCAIFIWFAATFISHFKLPEATPVISFIPLDYELSVISGTGWSFSKIEMLFPFIILIYGIGLFIQSFIFYRGYRLLQKLRKTSLGEVPADWTQIFYKVIAKLDINKKIDFHISTIASVPMVIGYFKPVILFPASLITSLDAEQVEAILIHELTHIRRNDYLLNIVKTVIETVLFFNPFVWLTGRFIRIEREHICDDMVLKYTGQPVKYAETLLQIELEKSRTIPRAAMAAVSKKQHLFNRIKRITTMKTNYMNIKQQLAGVSVLIVAVLCLAWLAPSENLPSNGEKKIQKHSIKTIPHFNPKITLTTDLTDTIIDPKKKKEIKIIVTDPDGKTKEYNSIKGLPDSLKADIGVFEGRDFSFIADSLMLNGKALRKQFKRVFNDTTFLRGQREIAEQFNSPEFKDNMRKTFESFNSPAFKKEMEELKKQFNSEEFKKQFNSEEFKKQQEEIKKQLNSAEFKKQQAELKKMQSELREKLNSKEFKESQRELISRLNSESFSKMPQLFIEGSNYTISGIDSLFVNGGNKGNYRIYLESREKFKRDKELENNKQYQKLKKKFERDVEKLRKKQAENEMNRK